MTATMYFMIEKMQELTTTDEAHLFDLIQFQFKHYTTKQFSAELEELLTSDVPPFTRGEDRWLHLSEAEDA